MGFLFSQSSATGLHLSLGRRLCKVIIPKIHISIIQSHIYNVFVFFALDVKNIAAIDYAIVFILVLSSRVSHLILVDPWGFPERPQIQSHENQGQTTELAKRPSPPRWVKAIVSVVSLFNPLAVIRAAGPWGETDYPCTGLLCTILFTMCPFFRSGIGEPISSGFQKKI